MIEWQIMPLQKIYQWQIGQEPKVLFQVTKKQDAGYYREVWMQLKPEDSLGWADGETYEVGENEQMARVAQRVFHQLHAEENPDAVSITVRA